MGIAGLGEYATNYPIPWKSCFFLWNTINKIITNNYDLLIEKVSGTEEAAGYGFCLHAESTVCANVIVKFQHHSQETHLA